MSTQEAPLCSYHTFLTIWIFRGEKYISWVCVNDMVDKNSKLGRSLGGMTCPRKGTQNSFIFHLSTSLYIHPQVLPLRGCVIIQVEGWGSFRIPHSPHPSSFHSFYAPRTEQSFSWGMGENYHFPFLFLFIFLSFIRNKLLMWTIRDNCKFFISKYKDNYRTPTYTCRYHIFSHC